jgi:ChpA-C
MYDLAKRSLAFTVATSGLLLTGTAYTPALAAVGVGPQGPAQAQGVQNGASTSASSVNTAGSSGDAAQSAPEGRAAQAPPDLLSPDALHPNIPAPAPRAGSAGPGAAATSSTRSSGGIASGNTIQIPINIGIDLCGNNVKAGSLKDTAGGGACETQSGSSASSTTSHSGGIGSGNNVQAPVNVPILACDNTVGGVVVKDTLGGADCSAGAPGSGSSSAPAGSGGAGAGAQTDHSGGILSGNIVQAPVNVPVDACGNDVNAVTLESTESGSDCENSAEGSAPTMPGAPAPGSGGASATATSVDNGGIGSGTTVQLPINVPVNVCGNDADGATFDSKVSGGACEDNGGSATSVLGSTGNSGIVSGNSVQTPIQVPVNACGTEATAVGEHIDDQNPDCSSSTSGGNTPPGSTAINVSSNNGGIGSGNSAQTPINVPVNACGVNGTAVGVHDEQTSPECSTSGGGTTTVSVGSNNGGIGSGNNVPVQGNVPVNLCGADVAAGQAESAGTDCSNAVTPPPGGGSTTPPPGGGSTTPPPGGGSTTPPPGGGSTTPPPGGGSTTPPPGGGSTTPPPGGGSTTPPPGGGSTTPPPGGGSTTPPPGGGSTTPPPGGGSTTPPPGGGSTTPPPGGGSTTPPPNNGSTTPPPSTGTTPPGGPTGPSNGIPPQHQPGAGNSANGPGGSNLAHTGTDIGIALGVAGAALLGGLGLRAAARRREGE